MRTQRYKVELTPAERACLLDVISSGEGSARTLAHARVRLQADQGPGGPMLIAVAVAEAVEVSESTVAHIRRQFVERGLDAALNRRGSARAYPRKLDGAPPPHLVALTCTAPPTGRAGWTLRLLADKLIELDVVADISYETVRRTLTKQAQAVAEAAVPHPTGGQRGVRLAQGGRPGRRHPARRCAPPAGLQGRGEQGTAHPGANGAAAPAGEARAGRL